MSGNPHHDLYYWPGIQGRGEFVRLIFEDAGMPYRDMARLPEAQGGGRAAILRMLDAAVPGTPPFAPPVLHTGDLWLAQTALICRHIAAPCRLLPAGETARLHAEQLMITIMDMVVEAHDVHHPLAKFLYYEEQQAEALRRAAVFHAERLPKLLGYFERALATNGAGGGPWLVGATASYVDLALFQLIAGLGYAFPQALAVRAMQAPRVMALHGAVAGRPGIGAYLASPRRLPFNEHGIFRHYPELDLPAQQ